MGRLIPIVLFWLFSGIALADDDERAKQLYKNGIMLIEEGHYEEAIEAFQAAYDISKRELLLFNIASAQEQAGHLEEARKSFTRYRVYAPVEEHEGIKIRIAAIDVKIEEAKKEETANAEKKAQEEKAAQEAALIEAQREAEVKDAAAVAAPNQDATATIKQPPSKGKTAAIWSASAVSLGAAVFGTLKSRQILSELTDPQNCRLDNVSGDYLCIGAERVGMDEQYQTYALMADIGWGLTIVSAGTGAVMQFSHGASGTKTLFQWQGRF